MSRLQSLSDDGDGCVLGSPMVKLYNLPTQGTALP